MTPKEKALELCNRFMLCNSYQAIVWYNARLCALIAVDEILSMKIVRKDDLTDEYWESVKQEIEKI